MRPPKGSLLHCYSRARFIDELATRTWNTVRVGQMPVSIHNEQRAGELLAEGIACGHSCHQVRSEVSSPGSAVVEVIFGVERIVADQAAEDSALQGEPFANGRKIRRICWPEVTQEFEP